MVGLGVPPQQKKSTRVTQVLGDVLESVYIAVAQTLDAPAKFRITCVCTEVTPEDTRDVCKWLCLKCQMFCGVALEDVDPCCDECGGELTFYYVFQLTLKDATGSLGVRVCGEFAETLLGGGVPPTDLRTNNIRCVRVYPRVCARGVIV